jgi:23S rRNA pseudouridine2605 synthase/16S rRNA pseudouridine516 synthase
MAQRLHVVLARAGIASRRQSEKLISEGRVEVNGEVVLTPGTQVSWEKDIIRFDGQLVRPPESIITVVLNKPKGVVTTAHDPQKRPTAMQLVEALKVRLFPVGRLDYHTEGLLLLTNDGELAYHLQHPRFGVPKTYRVKVKGMPSASILARLRSGVVLDRRRTAPAKIRKVGTTGKNTWLEITIKEGRNRQIRRMCAAVGHPVMKLKRTQYGPIRLAGLKPGAFRRLSTSELNRLGQSCGMEVVSGPSKTNRVSKKRRSSR